MIASRPIAVNTSSAMPTHNRPQWGSIPRRVPLTKHAQVVVEIGGYVAPHSTYLFPKGAG